MGWGDMKGRKDVIFVSVTFFVAVAIWTWTGGVAPARGEPFPTYGTGLIQVRIYTDYFCPPCRGMEPYVEPVLKALLKRNAITLTLVDTPFYRYSPLYSRYFLYALQAKNNSDRAFLVRNVLNEAAENRHFTTSERIEEVFKGKGISWQAFDPQPIFDRYNALIKEDHIDATPSCVIIRSGRKEKFVGGPDIVKALKGLQP